MLKEALESAISGPWKTAGDDVQYRISDNTLYLQWTESLSDWKANLDFPAVPYRGQPVPWMAHRGLARKWKSARDAILTEMGSAPVKRVIGYSQGGALAVLAHEDLLWVFGSEPETYAFAPPRVLWLPCMVRKRWSRLTTVINRGDIVTAVPPWWLGYCHAGTVMRVGSPSKLSVEMHMADEYLKALEGH